MVWSKCNPLLSVHLSEFQHRKLGHHLNIESKIKQSILKFQNKKTFQALKQAYHRFQLSLKVYREDFKRLWTSDFSPLKFQPCDEYVWAERSTIWTSQRCRSGSSLKLEQILELQWFFFFQGKERSRNGKTSVRKTKQGPKFRAEEVCNGESSWDSCAEADLTWGWPSNFHDVIFCYDGPLN